MPGEEKPYRVYRGGRQKGKVPLQAGPSRAPARPRKGDGSDFPGPGPIKEPKERSVGRRIAIAAGVLLLLIVIWAVASFLSFRSGVNAANKRLPVGTEEALAHQDSLIFSTPTDILLLGTDHANQPGHETQHADSIMLIRTDPSRHRVVYLSIP